jgi:cell wall assembly regulator SMI1
MKPLFDRIHVWLSANAPEVLASLRPGATEEQIRAAERELDVRLPEDVRAAYRIHDGCEGGKFLFGWVWLDLDCVVRYWRAFIGRRVSERLASPPGVRSDRPHPALVTLTTGGRNHCCLNLAPGPGGEAGQIILWSPDGNTRFLEARSFREWLTRFADELEAGYWEYDGWSGGLREAANY